MAKFTKELEKLIDKHEKTLTKLAQEEDLHEFLTKNFPDAMQAWRAERTLLELTAMLLRHEYNK